ncbi:hypothetical protein DENIT_80006 [Pseudomonas veronii]|nr:hypothetical protein DENIT_80006 [Pseudomonas veronii]
MEDSIGCNGVMLSSVLVSLLVDALAFYECRAMIRRNVINVSPAAFREGLKYSSIFDALAA